MRIGLTSVYKAGKPPEEVAVRLRVVLAIAVGIALATPARASEPGQPLTGVVISE